MEEEPEDAHTATCPACGGHEFRIYVLQRIFVVFAADGDHEVVSGPEGDMEWDDTTEVFCNNCDHFGPLGEMK